MKKIFILALATVFSFATFPAFASTVGVYCYMDNPVGNRFLGLPYEYSETDPSFYLTIDDVTGDVISFKNLFSDELIITYGAGGWNTEDYAPFEDGEQVFERDVTYSVSDVIFDGNAISEPGHGLWYMWLGLSAGILSIDFVNQGWCPAWEEEPAHLHISGSVLLGTSLENADLHEFSGVGWAIPIPSAIWLLSSGIIGIFGIRRKFIKK